ncbi:hypothetical protein VTJ83DRAFT_483 [Remersonia thermophila]|uniref:Uncharacterized protein n=1 Tax=Remersonia thermophila TaxID=72144 RepID=A0ABR4DMU6_9PEZI
MASEGGETKTYSTDPALYIFTSLTAGSSHIVTATSRLETILRANRIPFKATDIAIDDKARMLWGRRAGKDPSGRQRKLPGLVQMGIVLGDIVEIEEWNEYGELRDHVTIYHDEFTQPSIHEAASKPPVASRKPSYTPAPPPILPLAPAAAAAAAPPGPKPAVTADQLAAAKSTLASPAPAAAPAALPIRSIAEEAAAKAKQVHLQSLRDKVYGRGATKPAEADASSESGSGSAATTEPAKPASTSESSSSPSSSSSATSGSAPEAAATEAAAAGLQSPTSSSWKAPANQDISTAMQSPRSTSWKPPADVDPPVTELHGAPIANASPEVIAAVERAETIKEEEEQEEEKEEEGKAAGTGGADKKTASEAEN